MPISTFPEHKGHENFVIISEILFSRPITCQFKALPVGLLTALMKFSCKVREMAQARGIRINQYLHYWLISAQTKESCYQDTQSLVLCHDLVWVFNLSKSKFEPKHTFDFMGYPYDLLHRLVRPTQNRWETLKQKLVTLVSRRICLVRQYMSLTGLLTTMTETTTFESFPYEAHPVGFEEHLQGSQILGKRKFAPSPQMMDQGSKCSTRLTFEHATFNMPFRSLQPPQMKVGALT